MSLGVCVRVCGETDKREGERADTDRPGTQTQQIQPSKDLTTVRNRELGKGKKKEGRPSLASISLGHQIHSGHVLTPLHCISTPYNSYPRPSKVTTIPLRLLASPPPTGYHFTSWLDLRSCRCPDRDTLQCNGSSQGQTAHPRLTTPTILSLTYAHCRASRQLHPHYCRVPRLLNPAHAHAHAHSASPPSNNYTHPGPQAHDHWQQWSTRERPASSGTMCLPCSGWNTLN